MPLQYMRTVGRANTIDNIPEFWGMWHDRSMDMLAIAAHFNVSITTVRRTARRLGLPPRNLQVPEPDNEREEGDPSEEEIWGEGGGDGSPGIGGLTGKIRESWSSRREHEARINATSLPGEEIGTARSKPHLRGL